MILRGVLLDGLFGILLIGGRSWGERVLCFLCMGGPLSFATCGASLYFHANVTQLYSSLSKTKGVISLAAPSVGPVQGGRRAITDPRIPPYPVPSSQKYSMRPLLRFSFALV